MAKTRAQKIADLSRLREEVASQKAVVILTTKSAKESLNASKNVDLRKKIAESNIGIEVVKNTLIPLAFEQTKEIPNLTGQNFLVYSKNWQQTDEVTTPKVIVNLVKKEFADNFEIVGSVVNGEFYDATKTVVLSKTPSKQDSMAMVAGMLQTIGGGKIASLSKEIVGKLARAIGEVAKTKNA